MSTLDPAEVTMQAYDRTAQRYFQRWHDVDPLVAQKQTLCDALPPDGRLLDVGCGTGRDLLWFRHRGVNALGLDRSSGMLELAGSATSPGRLMQADMRQIPLSDGSIDAWWASASLLHLGPGDALRALGELHRVTAPAGMGFLTVKEGKGHRFVTVDDGPEQRFFCYWTGDDLDAALARAGWVVVSRRTADDHLGREPWLYRLVARESRVR